MNNNMMALYALNHTHVHNETFTGFPVTTDLAVNAPMGLTMYGRSTQEQSVWGTNPLTNGDFHNGTTGWYAPYGSLSASDNAGIVTVVTPSYSNRIQVTGAIPYFVADHFYYARCFIRSPQDTPNCRIYLGNGVTGTKAVQANTWDVLSGVRQVAANSEIGFYIPTDAMVAGQIVEYKQVMVIDLTAIFESGKEPTKAVCDQLFATWFSGKSKITNDITTYPANSPSVNYPAAIQPINGVTITTHGKNLIDLDASKWAQGTVASGSGAESGAANRIRSDFIAIKGSTNYTLSCGAGFLLYMFQYNGAKGYISNSSSWASQISFTTSGTTKYIRILIKKQNEANIIPSEASLSMAQIERGTTATEYTPFSGTTLNRADVLRGLVNARDTLDVTGGILTRGRGVKVFDGTETPGGFSERTNTVRVQYTITGKAANGTSTVRILSSHGCSTPDKYWSLDEEGICELKNDNFAQIIISVTKTRLSEVSANGVKAWLAAQYAAGTPITVEYDLATLTTESVTASAINSVQGGMTITAESNGVPVDGAATIKILGN